MKTDTVESIENNPQQVEQATWVSRLRFRLQLLLLTRSSYLFAALMLANVIAYLYHMLMARMMTPADYGITVTLTSISYLLDVIVRTVQAAVTKTVASMGDDSARHARNVFIVAIRVLLPIAGVVFLVMWASSSWVAGFLNLVSPLPVILLGLYASLHFLGPLPRGILLGLGRLNEASVTVILEPVVRLGIGLALVAWGWGANGAMTGYTMGGVITFLVGMMMIRALLTLGSSHAPGKTNFEGFDRYAILVFIINSCLMIIASIDQVVIKHYFSPEIAGNYAVTFVVGRVILMTAISLGIVIFTRSATMEKEDPKHRAVLAKGVLMMGAISAATILATLAAPALIVRLMAGSQYNMAQSYIGLVGIEMSLFGLVYVQVYYHISINNMRVLWLLLVTAVLEIVVLANFHASVQQVLMILITIMVGLLVVVSGFSWNVLRRNEPLKPIVVNEPL